MNGPIKTRSFTDDFGTAGISETFEFNQNWKLVNIMFHFSAATTETITVEIIDSALGANFDTVLTTISPSAATDSFNHYGADYIFPATSKLKITSTNSGATLSYGQVMIEEV